MVIERVDHVAFTVADLDRSKAFYCDLLGMKVVMEWELSIGDGTATRQYAADSQAKALALRMVEREGCGWRVELLQFLQPLGRPLKTRTCDPGMTHLCVVVADILEAYELLHGKGVRFRSRPVQIPNEPPGAYIVYLVDPDGITVEFEQRPNLANGGSGKRAVTIVDVEHVGFTVGDLEKSISFYTDLLGMEVEFELERTGPTKEYISTVTGLPDTHMKVAMLRLGEDRLELHQYLSPVGRPVKIRDHDIGHTRLAFITGDVWDAYKLLASKGVRFRCSPTMIRSGLCEGGFHADFFDPDGICLELIQICCPEQDFGPCSKK